MRDRQGNNRISYVIACAVLAAASGCVPSLKQISAFGDAAGSLAESAEAGFRLANETTIDRRMREIAEDADKTANEETFYGPIRDEHLEVRLKLLGATKSYAAGLKALAEADFSEDITKAATDLNASLSSLAETYKQAAGGRELASPADLKLVSTAVYAVAVAINEAKKRKALKTVIEEAHGAIQQTCQLLAAELGPGGVVTDRVIQNYEDALTDADIAYTQERTRGQSSASSRLRVLKQFRKTVDQRDAAVEFFESVSRAIAKLEKAHAGLKEAGEDFDTDAVIRVVSELSAHVKSVKAFYDKLQDA